jgi:lipopolysaccharide/colanic/teichoic acid biosynthesis glycosyltransferase
MIRFLDVVFAAIGLVITAPLIVLLTIVGFLENGSPIFLQARVGIQGRTFTLIKLRTMPRGTPSVPTHLSAPTSITKFGRVLRHTKLDELPQLWNVVVGHMSLVGPRPCLPSQTALIEERRKRGVDRFRPGITGVAQLRGVDMSDPVLLAETDAAMLSTFGLRTYFACLIGTIAGRGSGDRVGVVS